jgi:hypothetical protein
MGEACSMDYILSHYYHYILYIIITLKKKAISLTFILDLNTDLYD